MIKKIAFLCCFILSSLSAIYGSDGPLDNLNYSEVSNLENIQLRYQKLMEELGCADNVFGSTAPKVSLKKVTQAPNQTLEAYEKECLSYLKNVRKDIIYKPAYNSFYITAILGSTIVGLKMYFEDTSSGGGMVMLSLAYSSTDFIDKLISSICNFWKQPPHLVDKWEIQYVKNQCFIPKELWPVIIENLMTARQTVYEQRKALNFLSFTLGLTTFKPVQPINFNQYKPEEIINNVLNKLNQFFENYEPFKNILDKFMLRKNVKFFLENLIKKEKLNPRPILLYGRGGIGKTYFAQQLVKWIQEFLGKSVTYEYINLTTPEELEGSEQQEGAFLKVLRNKCSQGTHASVVVMDEAKWLNKSDFEAPAKRVFNGDLSRLSTNYFGKGVEGKIELKMPPMLVIALENLPIEEENLKSRFDHIEFPNPKSEVLLEYAINLFKKQKGIETIDEVIKDKITEIMKDINSFRKVESHLPAYMDMWAEEFKEKKE